jgi:hypothetical protein
MYGSYKQGTHLGGAAGTGAIPNIAFLYGK